MVDEQEFKRALRRFASGVTVVTVASEGTKHGMTASSFASVSLDPPLVLVCLDKQSTTLELLHATKTFVVNVLSAEQEDISRSFAQRGPKPFDRLSHRLGRLGAPLLDDAIAWLECTIHSVVDAGDHEIVIGLVQWCDANDAAPLIYYDGEYRALD